LRSRQQLHLRQLNALQASSGARNTLVDRLQVDLGHAHTEMERLRKQLDNAYKEHQRLLQSNEEAVWSASSNPSQAIAESTSRAT